MTDYQWNKLAMYQSLIQFLAGVETRITTAAALISLVNCFTPIAVAIEVKSKKQIKNTKQETLVKNSSRDALIDILARVTRAGFLYAKKNNKPELMSVFNFRKGKLQVMRESELKQRAEAIYNEANLVKTEIAQFGVTQDKLDKLNTWISNFNTGVETIVSEESTRMAATQTLPELFKQADDMLEEMDDIVDIIDDDYPDFGVEYRIARQVKDLGGGHSKDETDEEPPAQ